MESIGARFGRSSIRSGSSQTRVIVILILVAAVFAVRVCLKLAGRGRDPDVYTDQPVWTEWEYRAASKKPVGEPSGAQPKLTRSLMYDATASLAGQPRGDIGVLVYTNGEVAAVWSGQYYKKPKINFDIISASTAGRVYPGRIYADENGEDPSKLYFLTKGEFLIAETDFDEATLFHRGGRIYVRGWIDSDYGSFGEIILTADNKESRTFEWRVSSPSLP